MKFVVNKNEYCIGSQEQLRKTVLLRLSLLYSFEDGQLFTPSRAN